MDVAARAAELRNRGEAFVVATVTWRRGPSSGHVGAKALVLADGSMEGWIGGACARGTVIHEALRSLADARPRLLTLGADDSRQDVTSVPMACASEGAMEVFMEPVLPTPKVHIVGSSPMTAALAAMAETLGWRTISVDEPVLTDVDESSMVVVATQGHYDEPAMEAALATPARYVGLVASRKRADSVTAWLRERGVTDEALTRVHSPAGIDLGAVDHREIAVAVLAELVATRARGELNEPVAVATPETAIDPICEMTVDVASARFVSEIDGVTYYFCAAGCQRAFEASHA